MNGRRNRRRGKEFERFIASELGGRRIGLLGQEDVTADFLAIECKERERLPRFLKNCMEQALKNRKDGNMAVVFLHEHYKPHESDLVVMLYPDWKRLYFNFLEKGGEKENDG